MARLEHTLEQRFDAPPARVWAALTAPDATYMGALRFAGAYRVGEPFGIAGRLNERDYAELGVLRACEPGVELSFSHWSRLWRVPDVPGNHAVLTITLRPDGDGTVLTLRHDLPEVEAIVEHAAYFWGVSLGILAESLAGERPDAQRPPEAPARS